MPRPTRSSRRSSAARIRTDLVTTPPFAPPSEADIATVSRQLGRPARNVIGIAARCVCGAPTVVATRPRLDDGTPFPTLYYLSHPAATAAISTLEANGVMPQLAALLADDSVAAAYRKAHDAYLADRGAIEHVGEIEGISAGGFIPQRCAAWVFYWRPKRPYWHRGAPRRGIMSRSPSAASSARRLRRARSR